MKKIKQEKRLIIKVFNYISYLLFSISVINFIDGNFIIFTGSLIIAVILYWVGHKIKNYTSSEKFLNN